jgi:hypothetical protein
VGGGGGVGLTFSRGAGRLGGKRFFFRFLPFVFRAAGGIESCKGRSHESLGRCAGSDYVSSSFSPHPHLISSILYARGEAGEIAEMCRFIGSAIVPHISTQHHG